MSSYIVKARTINRIVNFLERQTTLESNQMTTYRRLVAKYFLIPNTHESIYQYDHSREMSLDPQKLCDALYALNIEAVRQKYREDNIAKMPGDIATVQQLAQSGTIAYKAEHATKIQVLKNLQCLLYQCTEGNVPSNPLYKFLEELQALLAIHIVTELAEYQSADWD